MEAEAKLREQITQMLEPHLKPASAYVVDEYVTRILNLIKEAGYLPVEEVKLEVLSDEEMPEFKLKLKKNYHGNGRLYEILLYSEPNAGHGWKPIARFYPGFIDAERNAERMVKLWNSLATITHNEAKGKLYRKVEA